MKKEAKTTKTTTDDLAKMISSLGKNLDLRISKLESYMKQGFESLDNKVDHIKIKFLNSHTKNLKSESVL